MVGSHEVAGYSGALHFSRLNGPQSGPIAKPEPIMLSMLPIILSRISNNFIPMPSLIIPVVFFKFLLCQLVTMRFTVYLVADKWVYL